MSIVCKKCGSEKEPHHRCRECVKVYNKRYASKNREKVEEYRRSYYLQHKDDAGYYEQSKLNQKNNLASKRRFLTALKEMCGCKDCGSKERLTFDHKPEEIKLFDLGRPHLSWKQVIEETWKCDIRCISCHSRRHMLERWRIKKEAQ